MNNEQNNNLLKDFYNIAASRNLPRDVGIWKTIGRKNEIEPPQIEDEGTNE